MIVSDIVYSRIFRDQLRGLPLPIIQCAIRKEELFRLNPLHPSLRLHPLKGKLAGLYSLSVSGNYRIIFERMNDGTIYFISIGSHDIYRHV